jgi:hypothetical protein
VRVPGPVGRVTELVAPGHERSFSELRRRVRRAVGDDRRERCHGEQLRRCRGIVCRAIKQRLATPRHRRSRGNVDDPDSHRGGLQAGAEPEVGAVEQRRRAVEHADGRGRLVSAPQRERQHHRGRDATRVIRGAVERRLQMSRPSGHPGAGLGHTQLEQETRDRLRRRWLLEHASQVHGRGFGRAAAGGGARGLDQLLDDPLVGRRVAEQQMLGDALVGARTGRQQARRRAMPAGAVTAGELGVDAGTHDRMRERHRSTLFQDLRAGQDVRRRGCVGVVELGEHGGLPQIAGLQDRDRAGQPPRGPRKPVEPEQD